MKFEITQWKLQRDSCKNLQQSLAKWLQSANVSLATSDYWGHWQVFRPAGLQLISQQLAATMLTDGRIFVFFPLRSVIASGSLGLCEWSLRWKVRSELQGTIKQTSTSRCAVAWLILNTRLLIRFLAKNKKTKKHNWIFKSSLRLKTLEENIIQSR